MKHYFFLLIATILFISCNKDETVNNNNPFLPNYPVNIQVDMNLPAYSDLNFVSNPVYVNIAGAGIRGIIVMKAGEGLYYAYDAACPNQPLTNCSTMTILGINAVCPCDEKEYSLYLGGQSAGMTYPMKQYRATQNGSIIHITN
jgi:nitrite reductase/ring-hydroxylating ferredoxin subunit